MTQAHHTETTSARSELFTDFAQPAGALTSRRKRRAQDILAAARAVFLEKGFARASVSEIAARVGVVEGLVYAYYPSKHALLNAVLHCMYEPLIAELEDEFSRLHGVCARMRFLIWRHLRVYVEEPNLTRLILHEVRTGPENFQSDLHDLHVRYTSFLLRTAKEGIASGELRADTDVELLRAIVYGGIEHLMWATMFGHGNIHVEATADRLAAMVLAPLLANHSARSAPTLPAAHIARMIDDMRVRLDQIEQAVAATPSRAAAASDTPQHDPHSPAGSP